MKRLFKFCLGLALSIAILVQASASQTAKGNEDLAEYEGKKISSVQFSQSPTPTGEQVFSSSYLPEKMLREKNSGIRVNGILDSSDISRAQSLIEEYVSEKGYLQAIVRFSGELDQNGEVRIVCSIEPGLQSRVNAVVFTGAFTLPESELRSVLADCIGEDGHVYDKGFYEYFLNKCVREYFFSKGYFQARIIESRLLSQASGVLQVTVEEGPLFLVGKIAINGTDAFRKEYIKDFLGLKEGEAADGKKLRTRLFDDLGNVYADLGFIRYDAELIPDFVAPLAPGEPGFVNIEINIDEGRRYRLRDITFPGLDNAVAARLRAMIELKDGEYFSKKVFEEGLARISDLGDFRKIDNDMDVERRVPSDRSEVYISVMVKEIEN